jgi:hypothetical protein
MRRVVDAFGGLLIGMLAAGGVVLLAAGPIMNLPGKVDSNNALVVASVAPGTINTQGSPIANLPGKVDSNNALVVTLAGGSEITAPFSILLPGIGTTSTLGLGVENRTAAAAGSQQYSPMVCQEGQGWKTNATAGSQSVEFCWEVQPVQGSAAPSGNYLLKASINGGAFSTVGTFTSGGGFVATTVQVADGSPYYFGAVRSRMQSPANGQFTLANREGTNTYDITLADWGTTLSAESVSLANNGVLTLPTTMAGLLVVTQIGTANTDTFRAGAGFVGLFNSSGSASTAKDNPGSLNVYYDAGYFVQNLTGGTLTLKIVLIGG